MDITLQQLENESGATATLSDFKEHTDPKYIGPGTWNVIHRMAWNAKTIEKKNVFINLMNEICQGFPCKVCSGHCKEYIINHPMEEYKDIIIDIGGEKEEIGLFIWTWKFHNAVNSRIKKPIMSWDTAYNMYSNSDIMMCSKSCEETEDAHVDAEHSVDAGNKVTTNQHKRRGQNAQVATIPIGKRETAFKYASQRRRV